MYGTQQGILLTRNFKKYTVSDYACTCMGKFIHLPLVATAVKLEWGYTLEWELQFSNVSVRLKSLACSTLDNPTWQRENSETSK